MFGVSTLPVFTLAKQFLLSKQNTSKNKPAVFLIFLKVLRNIYVEDTVVALT